MQVLQSVKRDSIPHSEKTPTKLVIGITPKPFNGEEIKTFTKKKKISNIERISSLVGIYGQRSILQSVQNLTKCAKCVFCGQEQ